MAGADTRYVDYFAAALAQQPGLAGPERRKAVDELLARVEASLKAGGHAPETLAGEMALARAAAAQARGEARAEARAPQPAAPDAVEPPRRGFRPVHLLALLLLLCAYGAPLYFFMHASDETPRPENAGTHDLALEFKISAVDLPRDMVTLHVLPEAGALLGPDRRLTQEVTVEIEAGGKPESHTFAAGIPLTPWTVSVPAAQGDILEYPLDRYQVDLEIKAKSEGRALNLTSTLNKTPHDVAAALTQTTLPSGEDSVSLSVRRSGTIIFVVMLATMSLLFVTIAALAVTWQVYARGRKADFSMMTWVAALSFVIPSARSALPGGAPTGALIDFALFFWLQIAAVVAMVVMVTSWMRQKG